MKLVMLSGSFEYDSEISLKIFYQYMEKNHGIKPNLIIYKDEDDNQSLKSLEDADVLLVFTRRLRTEGEELERFKSYCQQGRPVVGVRTASHAFQNWLVFDKEILGGNYQGHYGGGPICHVEIAPEAKDHPILKGVSPFDSLGSLYKNTPISDDTSLLLNGRADENLEPVAWHRMNNGGRVFYTSLGHQGDFKDENFLRLLANGVFWAAG